MKFLVLSKLFFSAEVSLPDKVLSSVLMSVVFTPSLYTVACPAGFGRHVVSFLVVPWLENYFLPDCIVLFPASLNVGWLVEMLYASLFVSSQDFLLFLLNDV